MTIYFWSDLHIGHVHLAEKWRTWASQGDVNQHNEWIRDTWNARVKRGDDVYILGDVCMGNLQDSLAFAATLNGTKRLIPGNHDRIHPYYVDKYNPNPQKVNKWHADYSKVFDVWPTSARLSGMVYPAKARYNDILLSHFPWAEDALVRDGEMDSRDVSRYSLTRSMTMPGTVLIHGHTHHSGVFDAGPRSVHIGVDAHRDGPVPLDRLLELVDQALRMEWADPKDALAT